MSETNAEFKNQVLDILGLKIELQQPRQEDGWTTFKPENGAEEHAVSPGKDADDDKIQDYVNKIIDIKIKNLVGEVEPKKRKSKLDELNKSLKGFTLDDILKHVKGFGVGKGFYQAKVENVFKDVKDKNGNITGKEQGREAELLKYGKNDWLKKEGSYGTIGDFYSVRVNHNLPDKYKKNIKGGTYIFKGKNKFAARPGDIILGLKETNDGNFFKKGRSQSPAQTLEKGIQKIYGGTLNAGHADAVKDLESGVDISVKCWGGDYTNFGSLDALANYKREVKLIIFNYDICDSAEVAKEIFGNDAYVAFVFCRKNEKLSGIIKDGKLTNRSKKGKETTTTIANKENLDVEKFETVLGNVRKFLNAKTNNKHVNEVENFIAKKRKEIKAKQFENYDTFGHYYDKNLRSEIKDFLNKYGNGDRKFVDNFVNKNIIDNEKSIEDITNKMVGNKKNKANKTVNNKAASVRTCFDY